MKLKPD